ncbi:uncharacterized protein LOC111100688 [Crassostrea virginica]
MSKHPTKSLLNEQCETLGFKHRKTHRVLMKALQQIAKLAERNAAILRSCIARITENAKILEESNRLRKLRADILEDFKLSQSEFAEIPESFNYYRNFPTYNESDTSGMENASAESEVYDKHYGAEDSGIHNLTPDSTSSHAEAEKDAAWGNYEQERSIDGAISQRDDTGDIPEILEKRNDDERRADFLALSRDILTLKEEVRERKALLMYECKMTGARFYFQKRIIGEIAHQLDEQMLRFVFHPASHGRNINVTNFYGYRFLNVDSLISRESLKLDGTPDLQKEVFYRKRLEKLMRGLGRLGYIREKHAQFSSNMVAKYGVLRIIPTRRKLEEYGLEDLVILGRLMAESAQDKSELDDALILLDCLNALSCWHNCSIFELR